MSASFIFCFFVFCFFVQEPLTDAGTQGPDGFAEPNRSERCFSIAIPTGD
jgi:hypothetical protein